MLFYYNMVLYYIIVHILSYMILYFTILYCVINYIVLHYIILYYIRYRFLRDTSMRNVAALGSQCQSVPCPHQQARLFMVGQYAGRMCLFYVSGKRKYC